MYNLNVFPHISIYGSTINKGISFKIQ